jgi:hypothetical protein
MTMDLSVSVGPQARAEKQEKNDANGAFQLTCGGF